MNKKTIFLLIWILLLASCARSNNSERVDDTTETDTPATTTNTTGESADSTASPAPVAVAPSGTIILADGQLVAPVPVLPLSFSANGRLLTLTVAPGDRIEAGAVIATIDDTALHEAITNAELNLAQAQLNLSNAQRSLADLQNWEPDATAVAVAEANLTAAQASLERAETQDAAAGSNLTSAQVQINQAQRALADAQERYDTAHDPGRDWELNDPWRADFLKQEREATARGVEQARESLSVAYAQYNLTAAGVNDNSALSAASSVLNAQQALEQATKGPTAEQIASAEAQIAQTEISLEQSNLALQQAQDNLSYAELTAPWAGTVLSVDVALGANVGAGTPIITLLDTNQLQFHTSNLSERDLAQVTPGSSAAITFKSYPAQPVTAEVARIAPQSSGLVGDAAVFTVVLDLVETSGLDLRPGMTGRVEITNE